MKEKLTQNSWKWSPDIAIIFHKWSYIVLLETRKKLKLTLIWDFILESPALFVKVNQPTVCACVGSDDIKQLRFERDTTIWNT
jgi:hypothetical protein